MQMNKTIGFIGCGNMGSAMLKGILKAGLVSCQQVLVATKSESSAKRIEETYHVKATQDIKFVAKQSDIIIMAMKPNVFVDVIEDISDVANDKVIISVAAGISIAFLMECFHNDHLKVARAMPNTPACVSMAMSSLSFNEFINETEKKEVIAIFESFGECAVVEEEMIHAVIGISGSSPAYIFMILDAMIKNGIKHGLSKETATKFASQAVMGAAKMVATSEQEVDTLKVNVCSPNGTTIEAVKKLEERHLYEIIDEAMDACIARSIAMSK
ncbi:MAG: pyrroline-5-carboxylate reductase [Erysipelotrichia bacterium]|nr:pyrroline-5-carboxylate reductase [Erysipelotrichia bacterium]NCC54322.1 pyrroline-5-carboxylate reductase [Erysipelotrichia bacterium]